jgi:hypothetical protein
VAKMRKSLDSYPTEWDIVNKQPPRWLFLEFPEFGQWWREYFITDDAYGKFQDALIHMPESGDVMPGCGGLRKIRWPDSRRGKGKRGGLRIVYLLIKEAQVIVLVDVYDKNEAGNLSPLDKKRLSRFAALTQADVLQGRN